MATNGETIELNVAYSPAPYASAMREELRDIAEVCDGVYVVFSESDLEQEPDRIKRCVDVAHSMGLVTLADFWGYADLFAGGPIPSLFTVQHPECNCVTNLGRSIPRSCPNKPEVRAFLRQAVEAFIEQCEPDGVFWNKPQWTLNRNSGVLQEGEWACRCEDCLARFRERYGSEMPSTVTQEVESFCADSMFDLLTELCGIVKGCGEHLITSACVMPGDSMLLKEAIGQVGNLDVFGMDSCWRPDADLSQKAFIDAHTGAASRIGGANGKLVESWVCAWGQASGHETDAYRAAKRMAAQDIDCLSAWSYRDCITPAQSNAPNPADPDLVWTHLRQAYHEIREGDFEIRF